MEEICNIEQSLAPLLENKNLYLASLSYSHEYFGNIIIVVSSNCGLSFKFIKEKGIFWCEIWHNNRWFFFEDLVEALDGKVDIVSKNFSSFVEMAAKYISDNIVAIATLFSNEKEVGCERFG